MKKIILILAALIAAAVTTPPILAVSGDVAGKYYSTDIRTYLNGVEIDAINIGGQTLISAEDMNFNYFSVYWYDDSRELYISRGARAVNGPPPTVEHSSYPFGTVMGNYYETDIVTYLDGTPITAYNLGGRTYIGAEEMHDFGYVVDWNDTDRTLNIISPDRAGYEYGIFLSNGERPEIEEFSSDGEGSFSISYTDGYLTGSGDAKLFSSGLYFDGKDYSISMAFYQNEGLFYSGSLKNLLYALSYDGNIENPCAPSEKYDIVNENVTVIINGNKSEKIAVLQTQGNGHVDFIFQMSDIPRYKENEITDIYFSVGNTDGQETFVIEKPEAIYDETIVDLETKAASVDLLEQVRQVDGFNADVLHPFSFKDGGNGNFLFSCAPDGRTGDFSIRLDNFEVSTLAVSERN